MKIQLIKRSQKYSYLNIYLMFDFEHVLRNLSVLPIVLFIYTALFDFKDVLRNLSVLPTLYDNIIQFNINSSWIRNKSEEEEFIELTYLGSVISHWPVTATSDYRYVCICIEPLSLSVTFSYNCLFILCWRKVLFYDHFEADKESGCMLLWVQ